MVQGAGRYEGRPLLRLAECYVLDALGELSEFQAGRLADMTAGLQALYGVDGTWKEIIEHVLALPPNMRDLIGASWSRNAELARSSGVSLDPQRFAEMFADANFAG